MENAKSQEKLSLGKIAIMDQRRAQFSFWSSVTKSGKSRKVVTRKNSNSRSRKVQFPNEMKDTRMETSLRIQNC